jgi:hypothetical protein
MEKRVETLAALVQLVQEKGRGILSRIVTMDESAVSMHTYDKAPVDALA